MVALRVAVVSPVWYPVPPDGYGGTERIVSLLVEGLVAAGEDVTLFASGDSRTSARLEATVPTAPSARIGEVEPELLHALACLERAHEFDLVHDHSGPLAAALLARSGAPVLHTVHGPLTGANGELYRRLARCGGDLRLIALGPGQQRALPEAPWHGVCPNAVDVTLYPFHAGHDDYLAFLGRFGDDKGAHRAIEVARTLGLELRIGAKCREPEERAYFERHVRPHLGSGVEYLGELSHGEKVELLGRARALLFPIDWDEPFGLVMVEAMACGTPVIATRRGSVPEVLEHGRTGVLVEDHREMPRALEQADALDPFELRLVAVDRFSPERMVAAYLRLYASALAGDAGGRHAGLAVPGPARSVPPARLAEAPFRRAGRG